MTNLLAPVLKQKFFTNNGAPANGYKVFTYAAGTNTKLDTYQSANGAANTNPIILDFRGEANIWTPPNVAYKYVFSPPSDTDPPTAPFWTVDNVVDSQLVTLWGGVDTGIANAYVLNFTANFTAYQDGIVIYWLPSNTNTGPSTINVNGLGPVPITNQDGSALYQGQVQANQIALIVYRNTGFTLVATALLPLINTENGNYTFALSDANNIVMQTTDDQTVFYTIPPDTIANFAIGTSIQVIARGEGGIVLQAGVGVTFFPFATATAGDVSVNGHAATVITKVASNYWVQSSPSNLNSSAASFTGTLTGMTTTVTGQINYQLADGVVWLTRSGNAGALTGTSNSNTLTLTGIPTELRPKFTNLVPCYGVIDNNSASLGGYASVSSAGVITFLIAANPPAAFTNVGTKGLAAGWRLCYPITQP